MNENTTQDLEKLGKQLAKDFIDGTKTIQDIAVITAEFTTDKAKAIWDIIKQVIPDLTTITEDLGNTAIDGVKLVHDVLPSAKTKTTLSDGEVIEEKYYQTESTFKERIAKDEEHIKQYGNSGE
jgi:hypothetical protein